MIQNDSKLPALSLNKPLLATVSQNKSKGAAISYSE